MNKLRKFCLAFLMTLMFITVPAYARMDVYRVQPGDTLWIISQKYKVDLEDVIRANPQFSDPDLIYPGEWVYVPLSDSDGGSNSGSGNSGRPGGRPDEDKPGTDAAQSFEEQVLALCNAQRAQRGIAPLVMSEAVARVAQAKSEDMRDHKYFSHQSPVYGSPFDMLKHFGVSYRVAGENIARGQKTPEAVVRSWMDSEGHRSNILNPQFTALGVGYAAGNGTTYWTQIFTG